MSGKSRVVWFINASSATCCDQDCLCMNHIGCFFHNRKTDCAINTSVFCEKVCDIYVVQNVYIFAFVYSICKKWFEVLAIDLNVAVTSRHIVSVFIFENYKAEAFHVCCYIVKFFGCRQKQVISDDACRIFCCVVYIILRFTSFDDIGIDGVNTSCQTAASFDICFLCYQNRSI